MNDYMGLLSRSETEEIALFSNYRTFRDQYSKKGVHCFCGASAVDKDQFVSHVDTNHPFSDPVYDERYAYYLERIRTVPGICRLCGRCLGSEDRVESRIRNFHENCEIKDDEYDDYAVHEVCSRLITSYTVVIPKDKVKHAEEAWPAVNSALEENGISCFMHKSGHSLLKMAIGRPHVDADVLFQAKTALELLSRGFGSREALSVMNAEHYEIIYIGNKDGGLFAKFGIGEEEEVERMELLIGGSPSGVYLKELGELLDCLICVQPDDRIIFATGSAEALRLVRIIVQICIADKVPAVQLIHRIKGGGL